MGSEWYFFMWKDLAFFLNSSVPMSLTKALRDARNTWAAREGRQRQRE